MRPQTFHAINGKVKPEHFYNSVHARICCEALPLQPDSATEKDPEQALRALWDAQGVLTGELDRLIADVTAKAQPGAQVGPFKLPD